MDEWEWLDVAVEVVGVIRTDGWTEGWMTLMLGNDIKSN
jgi:hypothetical protein